MNIRTEKILLYEDVVYTSNRYIMDSYVFN